MDALSLNLCLRILDDQLVDAEDERFARVDDIELDGAPGSETRVSALIVGAGGWRWRVPRRLAGITAALTPNVVRRIPWELVQAIEPGVVRIGTTSGELGFGTAHHAGARWVDELGQETLRISSVLGTPVVGPRGEAMGRVHEVQARMEGSYESPGATWIAGVLTGRAGWAARLAGGRGHAPSELIEWSRLTKQGDVMLVAE